MAMKSSPRSPQLEKAHAQQRRPTAAKNKKINFSKKEKIHRASPFPILSHLKSWLVSKVHHNLVPSYPSNPKSEFSPHRQGWLSSLPRHLSPAKATYQTLSILEDLPQAHSSFLEDSDSSRFPGHVLKTKQLPVLDLLALDRAWKASSHKGTVYSLWKKTSSHPVGVSHMSWDPQQMLKGLLSWWGSKDE